jgi:23S rRNA A2030 N6-methylase RlmJ
MADEFAKGVGILTGGGVLWMAISAWLTTESFQGTQLVAPPPEDAGTYAELALLLRDVTTWFIIFGVLAFWVVIPSLRQVQQYRTERAEEA